MPSMISIVCIDEHFAQDWLTIIMIRQYATADNVFDYFANYQVISESGDHLTSREGGKGQRWANTVFFTEYEYE